MRIFKSGAKRSQADGKFEIFGYRHPLIEHSFNKYMQKHQLCEDGSIRKGTNWWAGWEKEVSLQSMLRHAEDLTALHAGLVVYKIRSKAGERTVYIKEDGFLKLEKGESLGDVEIVTTEDCLNAVKFNCNSFLLEHLK